MPCATALLRAFGGNPDGHGPTASLLFISPEQGFTRMALSDACFDFMQATAQAAETLATAVHDYAAPDYPISYGIEIDALRRACAALKDSPFDPNLGAELLRLAASVMTYHDALPETPEAFAREVEMKKLIGLLQATLDYGDAATVPAMIENIVVETKFSPQAAERLKAMLPKLGKSAYEIAIKIISDIGSATATHGNRSKLRKLSRRRSRGG